VTWELDPGKRLERLAPYVEWAVPAARLVRGELFWVTDGYLAPETFPISARVSWRGRTVGSVRAAFVGVVRAETGETHIYLRHTADALAEAWSQIARGIILPASVLPAEFGRAVWYPEELFRAQAVVLQNPLWQVGRLVTSVDSTPLPQRAWEADTIGTYLLLPYQEPDARRIMALLRGEMVDGWESLRLIRLDSTLTLPPPSVLEHRWNRFPTYEQIRDSVRGNGGEWVDGPVRYWIAPIGLGAYQTGFGLTPNKEPSLIWVSLAIGDRLGAGRSMADAYQNLLGVSAPLISANSPVTQIEDARRLLAAADSALRRGDMVAFGRAFEALRRVLEIGTPRRRN
jgi:uncharacterized membrane protein (UPF0182 family)